MPLESLCGGTVCLCSAWIGLQYTCNYSLRKTNSMYYHLVVNEAASLQGTMFALVYKVSRLREYDALFAHEAATQSPCPSRASLHTRAAHHSSFNLWHTHINHTLPRPLQHIPTLP
jgi:hypothetical protein